MRMHRFDPYLKDKEQKAKERAMRVKEFWKTHDHEKVNRERDIRIQRKRHVSMRARWIKVTLPIVGLALLFLYTPPVQAHCYSVWRYKTPQHCGGVYARAKHPAIVQADPPPKPDPKPITLPSVQAVETDQRTPEDIQEAQEHDAAVKAHHDEINVLMQILHNNEALYGRP